MTTAYLIDECLLKHPYEDTTSSAKMGGGVAEINQFRLVTASPETARRQASGKNAIDAPTLQSKLQVLLQCQPKTPTKTRNT
jgi:hypothetical protein